MTHDHVGRYFEMAYYPNPSEFRGSHFYDESARVKGALCMTQLTPMLCQSGYAYAGTIANLGRELREGISPNELRATDFRLSTQDLVVEYIRPALDDRGTTRPRRYQLRSEYALETEIFGGDDPATAPPNTLRGVFEACDCERMILSRDIHLRNAPQYEEAFFSLCRAPRIKACGPHGKRRTSPPKPRPTLGYLVFFPRVEPRGFSFVNLFGMSDTTSFVLAHLMRTVWSDLFCEVLQGRSSRLIIFEFQPPNWTTWPLLEYRPQDLNARIVEDVDLGRFTRVPESADRSRSPKP